MERDSEFLTRLALQSGQTWLIPIDKKQLSAELKKANLTWQRLVKLCAKDLNRTPDTVRKALARKKPDYKPYLPTDNTTPDYTLSIAKAILHWSTRRGQREARSDDKLRAILQRITSQTRPPKTETPRLRTAESTIALNDAGPVETPLPHGFHWNPHKRKVTCFIRRALTVIVEGDGTGSVARIGPGGGDAIRKGNGDGDAIRNEGGGGGDAIRKGNGDGDAIRDEGGDGDAVRDGDGGGHAVRDGDGGGHAVRDGAGWGDARRGGKGRGDARRRGSGPGNARREGAGYGWAVHSGPGEGRAIHESTGGGFAHEEGKGHK